MPPVALPLLHSLSYLLHLLHHLNSQTNKISKMAVSGFEGFEKRLELHFFFSGDVPMGQKPTTTSPMGLRLLDFDSLVQILDAVQCTIVSALGNRHVDSYVLSESSLFVYPTKIIIKTCGTTQLLNSIQPLISEARLQLGLTCSTCRYTRGSFIFPAAQPFPHTSFQNEVVFIEDSLPKSLLYKKASVMPSETAPHTWHVFTASLYPPGHVTKTATEDQYTLEVCMTGLDPTLAKRFFQPKGAVGCNGDLSGKEMTRLTRIGEINPRAVICDFGFDPCGYSMNSLDGDKYSTIHVTPEDGYSYASFECVGYYGDDVAETLKKVAQVFRPANMSVSATSASPAAACMGSEARARVARALETVGLKRRSVYSDEFQAMGGVAFQTFTTTRRRQAAGRLF